MMLLDYFVEIDMFIEIIKKMFLEKQTDKTFLKKYFEDDDKKVNESKC